GRDRALALLLQRQDRFVAVVQAEHYAFQVEQDVDDVLAHAIERRVLVHHVRDLHFGRRVTRHRREQHAAQGVAQRVAVAALEWLHRHLGVRRGQVLHIDDARLEESGLGHGAFLVAYFEYSSMIRLSLIVEDMSARAGSDLTFPFSAFVSTSIHSGMPRDSAASEDALMRNCAFDFSATSMTSPGLTS